jgi:hypothetical protein
MLTEDERRRLVRPWEGAASAPDLDPDLDGLTAGELDDLIERLRSSS